LIYLLAEPAEDHALELNQQDPEVRRSICQYFEKPNRQ